MNTISYRVIVTSTIIAGLIALAMFNTNPLVDRTSIATTVYAQSQAQSQQQQSQPPAEQQNHSQELNTYSTTRAYQQMLLKTVHH